LTSEGLLEGLKRGFDEEVLGLGAEALVDVLVLVFLWTETRARAEVWSWVVLVWEE
jgi:hypothetical protein